MIIEIANITEHPEHDVTVAKWYKGFWGCKYPERSLTEWEQFIGKNIEKPPITLIAINTRTNPPTPVGTVSLTLKGMEHYDKNTAWLTALFVIPEYRGKGIATQLIEEVIKIADKQFHEVYLFTRTNGRIYSNLGWKIIAKTMYQESNVIVMKKYLLPA